MKKTVTLGVLFVAAYTMITCVSCSNAGNVTWKLSQKAETGTNQYAFAYLDFHVWAADDVKVLMLANRFDWNLLEESETYTIRVHLPEADKRHCFVVMRGW